MFDKKALYQLAVFLLTAGAAVVALQQTSRIPAYDSGLKLIGAIVISGGIVILALAVVRSASPVLNLIVFHMRGEISYITEVATLDDLNILFEHYERVFGNDLIPQSEFTKWMVKNPLICHKVSCVKTYNAESKSRIAGFFDFEPLTSHAHKRLVKGVIEGWGLSTKDILSSTGTPTSYYIGSLGTTSKSQKDRAATLLCALEHLRRINSKRSITLLTNPITPDGLRLCKGFNFQPINEDKPRGVWKLELSKGAEIQRYERKVLKALVGHA